MSPAPLALRLTGITKRFGSLTANDDISLTLGQGEVLALLGENGAGKSTLVSILFGHYVADAGAIEVFGQPLPPGRPDAALAAGVGMVHQHFTLADNLTVLDNIMVGTESLWKLASGRRQARRKLVELGQRFGLGVDPDARVGTLSVGEKQRVEILKALYRGARVLILDEPTAVLTPQEVDGLFATLRGFVDEGLAVIFISHKLDEVMAVSRRVAVLRQGRLVAERETAATTPAELAELMVGRKVAMPHAEAVAAAEQAAPVIALSQVTVRDRDGATRLDSLDLTVHRHEIVAIAGVAGNGQQALVSVLTGLRQPSDGAIRLGPERAPAPRTPAGWTAARVGRIPEDRHGEGMIGDSPLWENAIVEDLNDPRFARWGMIRARAGRAYAQALARQFDVRAASLDVRTRSLSGGNMQKLILGRTLAREPDFIVADQPTWGLDIGAVAYVREQLLAARRRGAGVLLVSEDLEEIFALADRIAVLCGGKLVDVKPVAQWTPASVGLAMTGTRA
ncbi:ABC transporter ATP-binding protein [Achromobacter sp. AONIH1]|uniref:ABC transporter ATP-binding protein n=1 Tax=Achromobacter sp. AONIH1 TaxID=1758194 RepID=UPI000CD0DCE8|nr:ABC transporter ATP-binding protein [Achromobacter sp. AONIH1]AUT45421.1 ABC transporter ATP-binding protein [Achromobacter sp. AONIH1]MBP6706028.1 ABC transporter ATP-binding protein [Achromobacter sp.]